MSLLRHHQLLMRAAEDLNGWSPDNIGAATLSSDGFTAYATGDAAGEFGNVRGAIGVSTGRWYFEILLLAKATFVPTIGVRAGHISTDAELSDAAVGLRSNGARVVNGSYTSGWTADIAQGTTINVAFDAELRRVWFGRDGSWINSGDPAAGTGPAGTVSTTSMLYPAASTGRQGFVGAVTARFYQSQCIYPAPPGFSYYGTAT